MTRSILSAAFLMLAAVQLANATDRYFRDFTSSSKNGRFTLDAESPDNKGGDRPFASNFVYTFTDTASGAVLWTRLEDGSSPVAAWAHDSGWVVVRDAYDRLEVLDPVDGRTAVALGLLDAYAATEEEQQYVHWTTAGPMWDDGSMWFFLERDEGLIFVVRPWWGQRCYIDITSGRVPPRDDPEITEASARHEAAWALAALHDAAEKVRAGDDLDRQDELQILRATNVVSAQRLDAAVRDLVALEWWIDPRWAEHEFVPEEYFEFHKVDVIRGVEMQTRRCVQHAIRRAGGEPTGAPAFVYPKLESRETRVPELATRSEPKHTPRLELITNGMCGHDLIALFGTPDSTGRSPVWEYDVDEGPPHTLRITFENGKVVDAEEVATPAWEGELGRLEELNDW